MLYPLALLLYPWILIYELFFGWWDTDSRSITDIEWTVLIWVVVISVIAYAFVLWGIYRLVRSLIGKGQSR